ncbi:MAG: cyclic pyranopterin monophosphate synthase MoaC [Gemmatimonadaceae bacterium]
MTAAGESSPPGQLTHLDAQGTARMVDVSAKPDTERVARATGAIRMAEATLRAIQAGNLKKGDVLGVARIAGIMAGKRTAELVPLCHPIALHDLQVAITVDEGLPGLRVSATARTVGKTGVEMEAIVAASVALITIYDMAKALDRGMVITDIVLAEKSGGVTRAPSRS